MWKRNEQNALFFDPLLTFRAYDNIESDVNALITLPNELFPCGSMDRLIKIWKFNNSSIQAECVNTLRDHEKSVRCLTHLTNQGTFIASGSHDSTIRIWNYMNADSNETVHTLDQDIYVYSLAYSESSHLLAAGLSNNRCNLKN